MEIFITNPYDGKTSKVIKGSAEHREIIEKRMRFYQITPDISEKDALQLQSFIKTFKSCFPGNSYVFNALEIKQELVSSKTYEFKQELLSLPIKKFSTNNWKKSDENKVSFEKLGSSYHHQTHKLREILAK